MYWNAWPRSTQENWHWPFWPGQNLSDAAANPLSIVGWNSYASRASDQPQVTLLRVCTLAKSYQWPETLCPSLELTEIAMVQAAHMRSLAAAFVCFPYKELVQLFYVKVTYQLL